MDRLRAPRSPVFMRGLPPLSPGMRIGLLGGSFNPPHAAHRAATLFAMKRLQLDVVWWLVSPGNPLKYNGNLHALRERAETAAEVADHPRIVVSCLESVIGTRYTVDTVTYLRRRCSQARFVWIMGADNLAQFHRWGRWQQIANSVPIAIIDRASPNPASQGCRALAAQAPQALARFRVKESDSGSLAELNPPAWTFLTGLKLTMSSTRLRNPDGSWKS
jgi:nicotinate-nucleotide adenylyltransferase